jgi:hypothetical protein
LSQDSCSSLAMTKFSDAMNGVLEGERLMNSWPYVEL